MPPFIAQQGIANSFARFRTGVTSTTCNGCKLGTGQTAEEMTDFFCTTHEYEQPSAFLHQCARDCLEKTIAFVA